MSASEYSKASATDLLIRWQDGDKEAENAVFTQLYAELQKIASRLIQQEGRASISADDLLGEGVIRLMSLNDMDWQSRAHFLAMAARVMRRILVDHARARNSHKRYHQPVTLITNVGGDTQEQLDLDLLDKCLIRLSQIDKDKAKIVELRYFGGLSLEETAEVTGLSTSTVKRSWRSSRAWLRAAMLEAKGWTED